MSIPNMFTKYSLSFIRGFLEPRTMWTRSTKNK